MGDYAAGGHRGRHCSDLSANSGLKMAALFLAFSISMTQALPHELGCDATWGWAYTITSPSLLALIDSLWLELRALKK